MVIEVGMRVIQKLCDRIGIVSEWSGRIIGFLMIVLVLNIVYDVFARYVFNAPTIWSYGLSYMTGTAIIAMGMCYVYYHHANVTIDIIYSRLPLKGRLMIDVGLTLLCFFPLVLMLTKVWAQETWQSYVLKEVAGETIWYPPLWPIKLVVTVGFGLLFLQGLATFVHDVISLVKGGKEPW